MLTGEVEGVVQDEQAVRSAPALHAQLAGPLVDDLALAGRTAELDGHGSLVTALVGEGEVPVDVAVVDLDERVAVLAVLRERSRGDQRRGLDALLHKVLDA